MASTARPTTPRSSRITAEGGPDFKVAPLTSKEFVAGLTTQVSAATAQYFWEQGWSPDVLLLVLVRKVTLTFKNGAEYHFVGAIRLLPQPRRP